MKELKIGTTLVGSVHPPYVIAEISGNHLQSLDRCIKIVDEAKRAKASAVKIQTIDPEKITLGGEDKRFIVNSGPWKGRRVREIYKENMLPREWHAKIFDRAKNHGMEAFSSPFDVEAVEFLEKLDVPAYKIASNELLDWRILQIVANTGKPIIASTGNATKEILDASMQFLEKNGANKIALLYCVSAYPPLYEDIYLETIQNMQREHNCVVGLSDHTLSSEVAVASIALGASIVEKHFTLARADGGSDSHFSIEPDELRQLVVSLQRTWKGMSGGAKYPGERDLESDGVFTRQLWSKQRIKTGEEISWDNIQSIRGPQDSGAIPTYEFERVIGQICKNDIDKNEPIMDEQI